jgi:hypothetical protein
VSTVRIEGVEFELGDAHEFAERAQIYQGTGTLVQRSVLASQPEVGVADATDGRASEGAHLLSQGSRSYGVNSFQCPSETTSTVPSVTLMAV